MHFFTVLAAALASLSAAHAAITAPPCAQKCYALTQAPANGFDLPNRACPWADPTSTQDAVACITRACTSQADVDAAIDYATFVCAAAGITTVPDGVTTAEPRTATTLPAPTSADAAIVKTGVASAPIGVNQPLVLFGAAVVAFGLAL